MTKANQYFINISDADIQTALNIKGAIKKYKKPFDIKI